MRKSVLFILILAGSGLLAQERINPGPAYVYDIWRTDSGLPSNDIRSVIQTHDGYVWVATDKGLARFDGSTFHNFNSSNTPEFSRDIINHLCEDKEGTLWFSIDGGGLVSYAGGNFSVRNIPTELRSNSITTIMVDKSGRLWIGTTTSLYSYERGVFSHVSDLNGPVYDLAEDQYGNIIVAGRSLAVVTREGVKSIILEPAVRETINRICAGSDGSFALSGEEFLFRVAGATNNFRWNAEKIALRRRVNMLREESPGVFLVCSYGGGIERLSNGRVTPIRGIENLQGATLNVRGISRDQEDGVWIATGGGLLRMKRSFVWTISKGDGLADNHVWSIYRAANGTIWAGTETGGTINLRNGKPQTILTRRDGLPADRITAFLEGSDGSFWMGGFPDGLVRKVGRSYEDMTHYPGFRGGSVRALFEDRQRHIWVGTTMGLYSFDGRKFLGYPEVSRLASARVNAIQQDLKGDIWICAGRIIRLRADSLTVFKPAGPAGGFPAWSMFQDSGRVWFGTYGSGLHLIQGDSVVSFEQYTKELGPDILSIKEDRSGMLWLNTDHELQRLPKRQALDVVRGKESSLGLRVYGAVDGLTDIEFNGTGQHCSTQFADGTFLYASMNGVVVVDPRQVPSMYPIPPVRIEGLTADGNEVPLTNPIMLAAGTMRIDIDFCALTFESIPRVKFRCKLEGIDEKWQELSSFHRTVSYANLKDGAYRFHVIASNFDGLWNNEGATLSFNVRPYFYQTPAFSILAFIGAFSIVAFGYRWRTAALKAREAILVRTVDEKTAALKEEIEIRKETEEELRTIQGSLENRVVERTTQLSSAVEELRMSREQYQKIVDTAQEGIWMTDADDITIFANPKMAEILGCTIEGLIGSDVSEYLDREGKSVLSEKRKRHRAGVSDRYELDFIRKDGARVSTVISSSPILSDNGEYQGTLAMIADVTSQKNTEREHQRVEEELRQAQKMEAVGQLAGGIAHDFNNLLIPILGYSEMLLSELSESDRSHRRVTTIKRAAEKAASLTRQLLSFSRRQVMESKPINLNRVISEFSPILQRTIREDIEIRYQLGDDISSMKGDTSQIDQILINLLVNAQDAMPNGGRVTVETSNVHVNEGEPRLSSSLEPGRYVALTVADSGAGIAAEVLTHIFEPFFTTKEKSKGTGLGLATVYGIVKQHNGHIWVTSVVGIGTTFQIYFPAEEGSAAATAEYSPAVEEHMRGTAAIAVTEDDDMVRQFVRSTLEDSGYTVFEAATVEECLKFFRESGSHIDLLLTDVVMPTMNGRELYSVLSREFSGLRVMYMSGYSNEVISHRGILEAGVVLLQKPFTSEALLKRVREILKVS